MTLARLAEQRTRAEVERRALQTGYPSSGYEFADPSAIPPPGMYHLQRAGVVVNAHTLLSVDVVYTALRVISNTVIRMGDLRAYQEKLDPDAIPYKVWLADQPAILSNTFGGGGLGGVAGTLMQSTGRERTVMSMGLFGEAFWYILRDPKLLLPVAIEVLHPAFLEVTRKDGVLKYTYGSGNNKKVLPNENVIHIPLKSLPGANRALSPTDYAGISAALAMAAYEFGSSWFSQGQAPDFILSTDQVIGTEEAERIADRFMIRHGGLSQAHTPVVLPAGLKADKVMASPDEAQYLNTLEYARSVVGAWFGIPAEWLGNALQRLTPAAPGSLEDETMRFAQNTLSGYTIPLEEAHSGLLAPGVFAAFLDSRLSKPNAAMIAAEVTALRQGQIATSNNLRTRLLGWPPIEGGDDLMMPSASNVSPEQTVNPGDSPSPSSSAGDDGDD